MYLKQLCSVKINRKKIPSAVSHTNSVHRLRKKKARSFLFYFRIILNLLKITGIFFSIRLEENLMTIKL